MNNNVPQIQINSQDSKKDKKGKKEKKEKKEKKGIKGFFNKVGTAITNKLSPRDKEPSYQSGQEEITYYLGPIKLGR